METAAANMAKFKQWHISHFALNMNPIVESCDTANHCEQVEIEISPTDRAVMDNLRIAKHWSTFPVELKTKATADRWFAAPEQFLAFDFPSGYCPHQQAAKMNIVAEVNQRLAQSPSFRLIKGDLKNHLINQRNLESLSPEEATNFLNWLDDNPNAPLSLYRYEGNGTKNTLVSSVGYVKYHQGNCYYFASTDNTLQARHRVFRLPICLTIREPGNIRVITIEGVTGILATEPEAQKILLNSP
jgi:hypothetical protein